MKQYYLKPRPLNHEKDLKTTSTLPNSWTSTKYITYFNKTPKDIVCPHFWELKWAYGCPFNCTYCYLQGTLYGKKQPKLKNIQDLTKELDKFLTKADQQGLKILLNAGELCDSLAVPKWTEILINKIGNTLMKHEGHKILLVTKGGTKHIKPLLQKKESKKIFIVSFSLNSQTAAKKFEIDAPPPSERIKAAKLLIDNEYTVRLRIDPMIPIENWKKEYTQLIENLVEHGLLKVRITLGTLRGLRKTINFSKNQEWKKYLQKGEKTGWGLKIYPPLRDEIYRHTIQQLKKHGFKGEIALCKETHNMWTRLKNLLYNPGQPEKWQNTKCNCTW